MSTYYHLRCRDCDASGEDECFTRHPEPLTDAVRTFHLMKAAMDAGWGYSLYVDHLSLCEFLTKHYGHQIEIANEYGNRELIQNAWGIDVPAAERASLPECRPNSNIS